MNFDRAERFRAKHPMGFEHSKGDDFGWFEIPSCYQRQIKLNVLVAPSNAKWQHISISTGLRRCPTWEEMCQIKHMFFDPEEVVVQFHPRAIDYVNVAVNCLHLWCLNDGSEFPTPPTDLIGPK